MQSQVIPLLLVIVTLHCSAAARNVHALFKEPHYPFVKAHHRTLMVELTQAKKGGTPWIVMALFFAVAVVGLVMFFIVRRLRSRQQGHAYLKKTPFEAQPVPDMPAGTISVPPALLQQGSRQLMSGDQSCTSYGPLNLVMSTSLLDHLPVHYFDGNLIVLEHKQEVVQGCTVKPVEAQNKVVPLQCPEDDEPSRKAEDVLHDTSCPVCLEDMVSGDRLRCLPCNHWFHVKCVDAWLSTREASCPLCKDNVLGSLVATGVLNNVAPATDAEQGVTETVTTPEPLVTGTAATGTIAAPMPSPLPVPAAAELMNEECIETASNAVVMDESPHACKAHDDAASGSEAPYISNPAHKA